MVARLNNFIFFFFLIVTPFYSCIRNMMKLNSDKFNIPLYKNAIDHDQFADILISLQSNISPNYQSFLSKSQKADNKESISIVKYPSTFYVSYISIGTPSPKVKVVFDTGSGFFWVASIYCIANKSCMGTPIFNHFQSSSYKDTSTVVEVTYGRGKLTGKMCKEQLKIGESIVLNDQLIGEIQQMDENVLLRAGSSGLVGLGFPAASLFNSTLFDSLVQQKQLQRNVIGFNYKLNGGEINFGFVDESAYLSGTLTKHMVIEKFFWTLKLSDVSFGDSSLGFCPNGCRVAIDTGTSSIMCPSKDYQVITSKIPMKKDCSNLKDLKNIIFTIDNTKYELGPEDYVYKYFSKKTLRVECLLNIVPMDLPPPNGPNWVLGENFIRRFYSVFDRDQYAVYFGKKR